MKMNALIRAAALAALTFASVHATALVSPETKQMGENMGAHTLSEVKFDAKSANLSDAAKKDLADSVAEARKAGEIKKIQLLVWADREYPTRNEKPAKADVDLAEQRSKNIKTYLKDQLNIADVEIYNMAERPNQLQKWLKTDTAKVKAGAETTGAAPSTKEETGVFGWKGQASKAVAFVFMK